MAGSGAVWSTKQSYGLGMVEYQGAFSYNGTNATLIHGKGFTLTYKQAGLYVIKLSTSFAALITGEATCNQNGNATITSWTHPGLAVCGGLQPDNQTFFVTTYAINGTQADPTANNVIVKFQVTMSNSATNT